MDTVLTFLLAGGRGQRLEPLTRERPKPAIPAGGIYKLIDFTLSNCFNSGLRDVYVLVQHLSAELIRHLHEGWRLYFSVARDENLQAIPPQYANGETGYVGTADALFQNINLVAHKAPAYVLVLSGDHIYKMDYRSMLTFHESSRADLTLGAVEVPLAQGSQFGVLRVDQNNRVQEFIEKPQSPTPLPNNPELCLASMGIYTFSPNTLEEVLREDAANQQSSHDLGRDIVQQMISSRRVFAFSFVDENRKAVKYWRDVGTLESYYKANMDLVAVDPELNLYDPQWPIRTVPVQAPPPKFILSEPERTGVAIDSIVSPGCIVSGGRVMHSVVGPSVRINSWSLVEDCILFDGVQVGRGSKIRRAIVDLNVAIPEGEEIGYDLDKDRGRFIVTPSGIVVVTKEKLNGQ